MNQDRSFEDKQRELLEQKALVELLKEQSLSRQSDVPQMIISATQRRILLDHRHYVLHCLRVLDKHTSKHAYTLEARRFLKAEYDKLTTLIEQFNRVALERNSNCDPDNLKAFLDKIPATLIKLRLVQNLTQSKLARQTGISRFRLNRLERTFFASATLTELKQISEVLNKTSAQKEGGK